MSANSLVAPGTQRPGAQRFWSLTLYLDGLVGQPRFMFVTLERAREMYFRARGIGDGVAFGGQSPEKLFDPQKHRDALNSDRAAKGLPPLAEPMIEITDDSGNTFSFLRSRIIGVLLCDVLVDREVGGEFNHGQMLANARLQTKLMREPDLIQLAGQAQAGSGR